MCDATEGPATHWTAVQGIPGDRKRTVNVYGVVVSASKISQSKRHGVRTLDRRTLARMQFRTLERADPSNAAGTGT